jgi:hypothetical protein
MRSDEAKASEDNYTSDWEKKLQGRREKYCGGQVIGSLWQTEHEHMAGEGQSRYSFGVSGKL